MKKVTLLLLIGILLSGCSTSHEFLPGEFNKPKTIFSKN